MRDAQQHPFYRTAFGKLSRLLKFLKFESDTTNLLTGFIKNVNQVAQILGRFRESEGAPLGTTRIFSYPV
jgi:hypothetical protein